MNNTTKNNLNDFTIEEARGWIIESFNQIDWRLNNIIVDFFKPSEKNKFESVVLNTSIIDIGGKLKIIRNLEKIDIKILEKIRKLSAIRNGFAHAPTNTQINLKVEFDLKKIKPTLNVTSTETMIQVMNSNGEIKSKKALDYLREFRDLYYEIKEEFDKILDNE